MTPKKQREIEEQIWLMAFVAKWSEQETFLRLYKSTYEPVDGFSCAERADLAVSAFRDAKASMDSAYTIPWQEDWWED